MKKIVALSALLFSFAATAADVSVNYVRDFNLDRNGVNVEVSPMSFKHVTPVVSLTHVSNAYTRYGVGVNYGVASVGPVKLSVSGAGLFQDTASASNGYAVTVGANASYPITKAVNVNIGVNQFFGQKRIDSFNGVQATVGVSTKF